MKLATLGSAACCLFSVLFAVRPALAEAPSSTNRDSQDAGATPDATGPESGQANPEAGAEDVRPTSTPSTQGSSEPSPATEKAPAVSSAGTVPTQVLIPGTGEVFMPIGTVDVVVTGSRSRSLDLPGSVDVIGEEQTSKEVTSNALDLMRRIPGFAYQDYGNGGVPNGFMLRGFSSNHGNDALVIIDGVPINQHGWWGQDDGAPDLNQLTAEEIESIEVIKGPLDARFGNWARSGVVQIRTRQHGDFAKADASIGSYNTEKAYVSFGSEHADGRFNQVYSVESFQSDGWRRNSAQQRQNAYAKWFYTPSKDLRLGLFTHLYKATWSTGSYITEEQWQQDPRQAFNPAGNDGGYKDLMEASLHADAKLLGRFPFRAIAWLKETKNSRYADWTYIGNGQTEDHAAEGDAGVLANLETDWLVADGQTLRVDGGGDYRYYVTDGLNWNTTARVREHLNSDNRYIFNNGGLYLKASYDIAKKIRVSAGIRDDLFWGSTTDRMASTDSTMKTYHVPTYKAGIIGNPLHNVSVYGNLGTTFRLPNADAKYAPSPAPVASLLFWEAGVKATYLDLLIFRYAYFQSTEKETLFVQGQYVDDGKARRAGHEAEVAFGPWKGLELFTALTVHDAKYVDGSNDGKHVPIIPRYILKGGVQADTPWGTGARVNFNLVGKWDTDTDNTHSYGGYKVIDLSVYQVLARNWSVALDGKNIFDRRYSEFVSYWTGSNQYMPSPPRAFFATLRYATK